MSDKAFVVRKGLAVNTASPTVTVHIAANDAIQLPVGNTNQRPSAANGMLRYSGENSKLEAYVAGAWTNVATGSVASVAGSNTHVQFNDSGAMGGDANLAFDKAAGKLTVGNSSVNVAVNSSTIVTGGTVSVEGSYVLNANVIKRDATANLVVGYTTASVNSGRFTSGTFTPNLQIGAVQHYFNNGAHTVAPPSNTGTMIVDMINEPSSGAVTVSGFTKVSGDTLTTTDTHKFRFYISVGNGGSHLHKQALQ